MKNFQLLGGLRYNKGLIQNPATYLNEVGCNSWLYLVGEEFAKIEGGMSYDQVRAATTHSVNVVKIGRAHV